ncbi:hypothetical protein HID58_087770 [Brassica napus]|uniref:Uncharacterized protein n=1 Tax=Brassica napus TaxID=3708 RepID=A0ABQ7XU92_BRANA|nr:hypothetical protein HID58_087770 [Brassica napus]
MIRLYGSNWKLQGNTSNPVRIFVFDGLLILRIFTIFSICLIVWSKVVSIAEGLYARFSAAAVFLGPYKAGSFFFVDICNKNLDTFGDNHYYAQMVDTMHSLIKVQGVLFCSCTILRHDVLGQAVRIGDLELSNVQERFETFSSGSDTNRTGLRNTSILRNISISYSRISLTDVAQKLRLNFAHPMADA